MECLLTSVISLSLNVFYLVFLSGVDFFFQFRSVSISISIIWHAGLLSQLFRQSAGYVYKMCSHVFQ